MNDEELKNVFAELRAQDRRLVPPFGIPVRSRARATLRLAAAIVLLIAASGIAWRLAHRRPAEVALADWRAPSDVLLKLPGLPALDSIPDVTGSLLPRTTP